MKLKSTLWALAFACAAVSCSDDLDEGPNGNNGQEADGIKTYVKVAINTGIGTKASTEPSKGPDGGEGKGEELGLEDEYKVKDVTLILFDNKDNASATTEEQKNGFDFLAGSNIRGVGHADVEDQGSSGVPKHGWAATVQVVMDEEQSAEVIGKQYGVIAVTNLGKDNDLFKAVKGEDGITKINTGEDLADFMIKNETYMTNDKDFVMSTHAMKWALTSGATKTKSVVEIKEGVDEEHAATVSVFVERLAAKIRIKDYTSTGSTGGSIEKFLYTLKDNEDKMVAKVRLDQVAIVNQLTSGSYLLKRVSGIVGGADAINYLGDEAWNIDGDCNYVMDPWYGKHNKKAELISNDAGVKLAYTNRFGGTNDQNYSDMWNGFTPSSRINLATAEEGAYNDNGGIRLAYVMENVQQKEFSLNGYSTGALFKATYYPDQLTTVNDQGETEAAYVSYDGTEEANSSELNSITSDGATEGVDFYEYRGELFASQEAIFAHIINKSSSDKSFNYTKFNNSNFFSMTIKDYNDHFAQMAEPFGYIEALNKKVKTYTTSNPSEDLSKKMMNDLTSAQDFTTFMTDKTEQSFGDAKFYDAGVCYYPYWIRHANNNKPAVMGVMEFAIVRNNIYDLTVKGMNSWGFSGTDIPDPEDPDEDGTARINVELYVKNWVVRSNGDIIL